MVKTATVPAEPARFAASVSRWFPGARLSAAYEAGFSGFVLHRALTTAGITNLVVHPASVAVAANDRVKTDRRDAKRLAIDLADGRLRGIAVPTEAEALARLLPRTRAQLVEHRATIPRQIKATWPQFGLIPPASRRLMSRRYVREITTWPLPPELGARLTLLADQWRFATRQLLELRRLLRAQAHAQEELDKVSRSAPGLGEVVARTFATALGDMTRVTHERGLCSSTGLTPSAYASGASMRRGPISRQGASRVRHVLVETAWRALPRDPALQEIVDRMAAPRGKQRAMVAIARRLLGRIRACFRHGTLYAVGTAGEASIHRWLATESAWNPGAPVRPQGKGHKCAEALSRDRGRLSQVWTPCHLRRRLPPCAGPTASTGKRVKRNTALSTHEEAT
jgi:transposase